MSEATPEVEEEDDYMSDNLLAAVEDVKPGLARSNAMARRMKLEREQEEMREEQKLHAKKNSEAAKRQEAMNKPISEESKGFALLAKMGFKPGMNIGKQREDAIKEPIGIQLKTGRTGLGHEAHQKRKAEERLTQEIEITQKRVKFQNVLLGQYRHRKREHASSKQVLSDLRKSQSVCRDLDLREDPEAIPNCSWYWPPEKKPTIDEAAHVTNDLTDSIAEVTGVPTDVKSKREISDEIREHSRRFEEEQDDDDEEEPEPEEILPDLTSYLRLHHFYCVWCAVHYENENDLVQNCPGDTRQAHDDE